ncbi:hypothetical protein [Sphingomonas sp.]|uniref:hypothetical protein n=1 Tax=Sphingomonas sp. TaxID=28214 RepID=UPI003B00EA64
MSSIFIDANILLGFWSCRAGRVPSELLLPLVEIREHVLVTRQVADEVRRRKLAVFVETRGKFDHELPPDLPDHLTKVKLHADATARILELSSALREARKDWETASAEIAQAISTNSDLATGMLSPLLDQAVEATTEQMARARDRRERGNPPGKRSDPLGDQLSWEQFVDAAQGRPKVWIISRDSDFAVTLSKRRLINPMLGAELKAVGVGDIELHDTLSGAFRSIRDAGLATPAGIEEKTLEDAEKQEDAFIPHPPHIIWPDTDWRCPSCNSVNGQTDLIPRPSQYGGWSYWTGCRRCGFTFDTGEPYDE